jgi:hypothetical protein
MRVVIREYSLLDFGTLCGDSLVPAAEVKAVTNRIQDYTRLMITALGARGEPFTSQTFPVGDTTFTDYVEDYSYAYSMIRAVLATALGASINPSMRRLASAMGGPGIMRRARTLWERLQNFIIPLGWIKLLNELVGVFDPGDDDFAVIAYANDKSNAASITDWTDNTQVRNLLDNAEDHIRALEVRNAMGQFLQEILARTYKDFPVFDDPMPVVSKPCWDMHYLTAVHLNEAGSVLPPNYISVPSTTKEGLTVNGVGVAPGIIPMLKRSGVAQHALMTTFLRPLFYEGADLSGGSTAADGHCLVGLLNTRRNNSTSYRVYANDLNTGLNNTVQNDSLTGAQEAIGVFNVVGRPGTNMWDTAWWRAVAYSALGSTSVADWLSDTRSYAQFDYYEVAVSSLSNPTEKVLDEIWLGQIKGRG